MWEGVKFLLYIVLVHELVEEMSKNVKSKDCMLWY
jgi:hypothetical protein